jgi:hypothetical protein
MTGFPTNINLEIYKLIAEFDVSSHCLRRKYSVLDCRTVLVCLSGSFPTFVGGKIPE